MPPGIFGLDYILPLLFLFNCSGVSDSLQPPGLQHARLPGLSLSPGVCSNSCSLSRWRHPNISLPVTLFSSRPQSFPESGSFSMSWLFMSGGQSIGASDSASVLPMNIQCWLPLGLRGLVFLQSRVFSTSFDTQTASLVFPALAGRFFITSTTWEARI